MQVHFDRVQRKQKHMEKQVDLTLIGSLLFNCNNHIIFYSVNPIMMVIFVITPYAFEKGT